MTKLRFDAQRSDIRLRTVAQGLLASVAHDLEIVATGGGGEAETDSGAAAVRFPLAGLRVVGVVRKGAVDGSVLRPDESAEIERRMREALSGTTDIDVHGTLGKGGSATLRVRVAQREATCQATLRRTDTDGSVTLVGAADLSLAALGVAAPKGPLGAFRVGDRVQAILRVVFAAR